MLKTGGFHLFGGAWFSIVAGEELANIVIHISESMFNVYLGLKYTPKQLAIARVSANEEMNQHPALKLIYVFAIDKRVFG